jgi:hypothetical protein
VPKQNIGNKYERAKSAGQKNDLIKQIQVGWTAGLPVP